MRNTNKKGFTIVELVIVVAVIAILAAVLIPTFSGIINKANESADIRAVRNMNVALSSSIDAPAGIIAVGEILKENGFNTEKGLTPMHKDRAFYWFKPTNQVVYVNEADGKFELLFPEKVEGFNQDGCKSLNVAIEGVVNAPVVNGTTVAADKIVADQPLPEGVDTFEEIIEWVTTGDDKDLTYTDAYGSKKSGIALTGGTIKLTEDILLDVFNTPSGIGNVGNTLMFNILGDVTIDLNGHTITQVGNGRSMNLFIVREGTLNIIDSSSNKSGAIYASLGMFQINAGATVNLFGGKLAVSERRTEADVEAGVSIASMNGGTFNMYGGTIDSTSESVDELEYAFSGYNVSTSRVNIYGGTIIGNLNDEQAGVVEDLR